MSSVLTGNSYPQSFTVVSKPTGERAIPFFPASIPPSYQPHYSNTFNLGSSAELIAKLKNATNSLPKSTVKPTQPPPSFTPLSVSFDVPEQNTTDEEPTNYTNYYYIAGGILIALLILRRN